MTKAQSIVIYRNRPALVVEVRDKIEIRLEDGSTVRVRDKDVAELHPGPVQRLPGAAHGGDFETARLMLAPKEGGETGASSWAELAELVFGSFGPAEAIAVWERASEGLLFRIEGGLPFAQGDEAVAKESQRRTRKEGEAAERAGFIARARKSRAAIAGSTARATSADAARQDQEGEASSAAGFEPGDERFLAELEAFALGKSQKCRLCAEIGLQETAESAQAFLISTARWDEMVNPHPSRAGCTLHAARIPLDESGKVPAPERRNLDGLAAWAIDNAWSKDPDDAVSWDGEAVWVHVADPASLILPDSEADREALARGSTLYLPELTAPMLPDRCLELFGLGLSERSPALSFRILLDDEAAIRQVEVLPTLLSVDRLSYGAADGLLERGEAPEMAELLRIAEARFARRAGAGAVEIDIPEVRIHLEAVEDSPTSAGGKNRGGREVIIEPLPRYRSSGMVRELMLLAGEAAARWAFERSLPFPFYSQEAPSEPGAVAAATALSDRDAPLSVQFARRRLMRSGISGPSPGAHRGLGLPFYAQATSPLRRYQDLLGHMQIRAFLGAQQPLDADEVGRRCALAQAASAATRQAERSSDQHWIMSYLVRHPGWTGQGVVVSSGGPGPALVYIPELGLEVRLKLPGSHSPDEAIGIRLLHADVAALEARFAETV